MPLPQESPELKQNGQEPVEARLEARRLNEWDAAPAFGPLLEMARGSAGREMRLDLSGLQYVCSAGVGLFVTLNREVKARGGRLSLINVPAPVYEVFAVTRLTDVLDVRPAA